MWDVGVGVSGRRRTWEKSLIGEPKIKVPLTLNNLCVDGCVGEGKCVGLHVPSSIVWSVEGIRSRREPI